MDRCVKTARVSEAIAGVSMSKVVSAIEAYAAQLRSVEYLRERGETEAAEKLREKIINDLGRDVALIVDDGLGNKPRRRKSKESV